MGTWEDVGEQRIQQALRQGDLDVPADGRPLHLSDDPDWWVRQLIEREQLDMTAALPPAVALRKEADALPGSLVHLTREQDVRAHLEDLNARVDVDWRRPVVGPSPTVIARQVDVEDVVRGWRELRAAASAAAAEEAPPAPSPSIRRRNPFRRRRSGG